MLYKVSFLLANKGGEQIVGEMEFAPYEFFPTKKQFNYLYAPDGKATTELSDFRLESITYSNMQMNDGSEILDLFLTEMQLGFSNGISTEMVGAKNANASDYKKIEIDTTKTIRYV